MRKRNLNKLIQERDLDDIIDILSSECKPKRKSKMSNDYDLQQIRDKRKRKQKESIKAQRKLKQNVDKQD